jgi:hypothetical protein
MRRESLLILIGVAVVAWGSLLWFKFSGDASKDPHEAVVVVAPPSDPSESASATGAVSPGALPSESEPADDGTGEILITTRQSPIYGSPSASASVLYAFPAGRRLRVVGREGDFVRIKDVQSGATGWVDARTLAPGSAAAANTPTATSTPSASAEPSTDGSGATSDLDPGSQPAAAPPKPKSSATQRAATRPPANAKTAGKPPAAGTAAPATPAQKQAAAKREAQPAERSGPFPDFLKRAFGR